MDGFVDVSVLLRSGIYVLLYKGRVQWVGQSTRPFGRVEDHCRALRRARAGRTIPEDNGTKGFPFDEVRFQPVPKQDLDTVEVEVILRLKPRYNRNAGPWGHSVPKIHRERSLISLNEVLKRLSPSKVEVPAPTLVPAGPAVLLDRRF